MPSRLGQRDRDEWWEELVEEHCICPKDGHPKSRCQMHANIPNRRAKCHPMREIAPRIVRLEHRHQNLDRLALAVAHNKSATNLQAIVDVVKNHHNAVLICPTEEVAKTCREVYDIMALAYDHPELHEFRFTPILHPDTIFEIACDFDHSTQRLYNTISDQHDRLVTLRTKLKRYE